MKLICFPHYTAGGLLCDVLTDQFSSIHKNKGIDSFNHLLGKIGDSDSIFTEFDPEELLKSLTKLNLKDNDYAGTHCWPGKIDLTMFNEVICITTMTHRSKVYRWARAFYHYYADSKPWSVTGIDLIDKQRETAKNYLKAFEPVDGAINIEFSEIVDVNTRFKNLVVDHSYEKSIERWKHINDFLYHKDFWNSTPVQRFYEAELETLLATDYVYK
jgi:hypothetical protein